MWIKNFIFFMQLNFKTPSEKILVTKTLSNPSRVKSTKPAVSKLRTPPFSTKKLKSPQLQHHLPLFDKENFVVLTLFMGITVSKYKNPLNY